MPAAGTARIAVEGRQTFVPLDEAAIVDVVREGLAAQAAFEAAKIKLDEIRQRALALAEQRRQGRSSLLLVAVDGGGCVRVVYRQETKVDDQVVRGLSGKLPGEVFAALFDARSTFKLKRGWQQFMKLRHDDPTVEKLKPQIASAIAVKPCAPAISFLANPQPDEADHE